MKPLIEIGEKYSRDRAWIIENLRKNWGSEKSSLETGSITVMSLADGGLTFNEYSSGFY